MKHLLNSRFQGVEGGLFASVDKADVGGKAASLFEQGYELMAWADPFFPDPVLPDVVSEALIKVINDKSVMHYTQPIGHTGLRNKLAAKINKATGLNLEGERNVIITPGSDSGLLYACMPFIEYGDEVLVIDPSYASHFLNVKLLGGTCIPVPIYQKNNYQIDITEFEKRLTNKTKMIILTHPNNPTTTVFNQESLNKLADFVIKNDLILISDQAFEDHIYTDYPFISPASLPGMLERTVTVCSFSKGYGMSGFRVGYLYASDVFMDVYYGAAVNILGATGTINTLAALAILEDENYLKDIKNKLVKRHALVKEILGSLSCVELLPTESGILSWVNISKLGTSSEVVKALSDQAKVLVNSGCQYGQQGEGYIRIVSGCYLSDDKAEEVLKRIQGVFINLAKAKGIKV